MAEVCGLADLDGGIDAAGEPIGLFWIRILGRLRSVPDASVSLPEPALRAVVPFAVHRLALVDEG